MAFTIRFATYFRFLEDTTVRTKILCRTPILRVHLYLRNQWVKSSKILNIWLVKVASVILLTIFIIELYVDHRSEDVST